MRISRFQFLALAGAFFLLLPAMVLGFGELIESTETHDEVAPIVSSPIPQAPISTLAPRPPYELSASALSAITEQLSGSQFQVGLVRPVSFGAVSDQFAMLRAAFGVTDSFSLGLGKPSVFDFGDLSSLWFDLQWRLTASETFSLTFYLGRSISLSSYSNGFSDLPVQSAIDARFGPSNRVHLRVQLLAAGNERLQDQSSQDRLYRGAALMEFPLDGSNTLTLSLALQTQSRYGTSSYQSSDATYSYYSRWDRDEIGIPLGFGYRYERGWFTGSVGLELGPTTSRQSYSYWGSFSSDSQYDDFSFFGMANLAGSISVRF